MLALESVTIVCRVVGFVRRRLIRACCVHGLTPAHRLGVEADGVGNGAQRARVTAPRRENMAPDRRGEPSATRCWAGALGETGVDGVSRRRRVALRWGTRDWGPTVQGKGGDCDPFPTLCCAKDGAPVPLAATCNRGQGGYGPCRPSGGILSAQHRQPAPDFGRPIVSAGRRAALPCCADRCAPGPGRPALPSGHHRCNVGT